jgi:hypothetical protein
MRNAANLLWIFDVDVCCDMRRNRIGIRSSGFGVTGLEFSKVSHSSVAL